MSYGVFEHLAATDPEIRATKNAGRAIVAARSRVERRFGTFVQKAASPEEREDRIRLVADDLLGVVHAACMEHDYGTQEEIQSVLTQVLAHLRTAADPLPVGEDKKCQWCGGKGTDGPEPCGPCKGSGWVKEKKASSDDDEGGEHECYCGKQKANGKCPDCDTKTADSNNPTSYAGGTEAPDKDTSLDVSTDTGRPDFLDVASKRHPSEAQSVEDSPSDSDYETDPLAASTNDAVSKTVDADTPIGSEETGPKTQTFDGGGQATPVTSKLRIV
jgi:hypothetical protein